MLGNTNLLREKVNLWHFKKDYYFTSIGFPDWWFHKLKRERNLFITLRNFKSLKINQDFFVFHTRSENLFSTRFLFVIETCWGTSSFKILTNWEILIAEINFLKVDLLYDSDEIESLDQDRSRQIETIYFVPRTNIERTIT